MKVEEHPQVVFAAPVDYLVDEEKSLLDQLSGPVHDDARVDRKSNVIEALLGNSRDVCFIEECLAKVAPELYGGIRTHQISDEPLYLAR